MATYYISPTGNDSTGTGTSGNPWQTVSKAFSSSIAGDTILIDSANGNLTWVAQDFTSLRLISSFGGGVAVISGGSTTFMWTGSITVSDVQFQNFSGLVPFFPIGTNSTMTFIRCKFVSLTVDFGIFAFNGSCVNPALVFQACLFQNCKTPSSPGHPCFFYIVNDTVGTTTISMTNCTIYSNVATGITMSLSDNGGPVVNPTISLVNNIMYNANGVNTVFYLNTLPTFSGSNNDILGFSSVPSLTGNISTDPLFVDAGNNNFNLRNSSPCLDTGTMI